MKGAAVTLLVLLVCLSGVWALGDSGGRVKGSESISPDIWTELRSLRNMVVEQTVVLRNMEAKLRDSEKQMEEMKRDLCIFTAPVKGVYYFRFTAMDRRGSALLGVNLYKGVENVMHNGIYNLHSGNNEPISNAVVLELYVGDVVYMRLPAGYGLYDDSSHYTTFSGFLLFPISMPLTNSPSRVATVSSVQPDRVSSRLGPLPSPVPLSFPSSVSSSSSPPSSPSLACFRSWLLSADFRLARSRVESASPIETSLVLLLSLSFPTLKDSWSCSLPPAAEFWLCSLPPAAPPVTCPSPQAFAGLPLGLRSRAAALKARDDLEHVWQEAGQEGLQAQSDDQLQNKAVCVEVEATSEAPRVLIHTDQGLQEILGCVSGPKYPRDGLKQ
ncbi:unnamed protein product, partial [Coregonus sp. 'balchen']